MKYTKLAAVVAVVLGTAYAMTSSNEVQSQTCRWPDSNALASVHRVLGGPDDNGSGSAVHTRELGWVTAGHVINPRAIRRLATVYGDTQLSMGNLVSHKRYTPQSDAGLFESNYVPRGTVSVDPRPLKAGDPVWSVGYALGRGLQATQGAYQGPTVEGGMLRMSAWMAPGMSGGAILTCRKDVWRLAGINTGVAVNPISSPYGALQGTLAGLSYGTSLAKLHELSAVKWILKTHPW